MLKLNRWLSIGVALLLLAGLQPAHAMPRPNADIPTAIDSYITAQMQALSIPGVALAVVQGEEMLYTQGYGVADASGRQVTPQTPFLIASVSKSFTALAIMQLAEAGQLDLDAPVQTYLPWFRVADAEASARMTLRHLLYHTSGFSEVAGYERNLDENLADDALEQNLRQLQNATLNHPLGSVYEYSNTNYDILGLIIQTVFGQSYEAYIQDHIFAPLEMNNSFTTLAEARANQVASSYYPFFGFPVVYDAFMPYGRATKPSAGLFASAEDLAHYLLAHLNEGRYASQQIISPAGMAELHRPGVTIDGEIRYAMGWVIFPFPDLAPEGASGDAVPIAQSHAGVWAGFTALLVLIPDRDLGVVILMNSQDPRQSSAFFNLGWNLPLLALGGSAKTYPPQEDWVTQNLPWIGLGLVILLIGLNVWQFKNFPRWRAQWAAGLQRRQIFGAVLIPFILEIALGIYGLFIRMPDAKTTPPLTLRFEPDNGLVGVVIFVLTLVWAPLRVGWLGRGMFKKTN